MIEYFAHRLPRHSQTPARYLRSSGKRVALEGQTRFRRPRLAVERRKVARRSSELRAPGFAGKSALENGAKATRSPSASRLPGVLELREASGVRRVHRRIFGARDRKGELVSVSQKFERLGLPDRYSQNQRLA